MMRLLGVGLLCGMGVFASGELLATNVDKISGSDVLVGLNSALVTAGITIFSLWAKTLQTKLEKMDQQLAQGLIDIATVKTAQSFMALSIKEVKDSQNHKP